MPPIMPRAARPDALRGSVDLLVLKALSLGATHGWGLGLLARLRNVVRSE